MTKLTTQHPETADGVTLGLDASLNAAIDRTIGRRTGCTEQGLTRSERQTAGSWGPVRGATLIAKLVTRVRNRLERQSVGSESLTKCVTMFRVWVNLSSRLGWA